MAKPEKRPAQLCPRCGEEVTEGDPLQACSICRTPFCERCAVIGFGRYFCSSRCRDFFFHGDGEEEEEAEAREE